jgi:excisionase family DNA binding protein
MPVATAPIPGLKDRILAFERALTAEEVATLFSTHEDTIRKSARRGDIPSFRIGTSVRFDPKFLAEWYERQ